MDDHCDNERLVSGVRQKMKKQKRKIILFKDNATSHPNDLKLKSVNLVFFPPNATSILQPLDQGIIHSFIVQYRKLLLRHVLSQINSCKSSEELAKLVSVLDAISWSTSALKKVEPGCVLKCFKKAGFLVQAKWQLTILLKKLKKNLRIL